MPHASAVALALLAAVILPTRAEAPSKASAPALSPPPSPSDYARDQITVSTEGRSRSIDPTATCLVWADAEGFGVGPAQLGGLHGVTLTLVVHPLAGESPKGFSQGMAEAKAAYPNAPDWLMRTLTANQAAIETACGQDHPEPYAVHRITRADAH